MSFRNNRGFGALEEFPMEGRGLSLKKKKKKQDLIPCLD